MEDNIKKPDGDIKDPTAPAHNQSLPMPALPLCVDLDGTLIDTDTFPEAVLLLLHKNPLYLFLLPFWLLRGKAALKGEIAARVQPSPQTLPYNPRLLAWLKDRKAEGRPLWLCTGAHESYAAAIAAYLGIFEGYFATKGTENFVSGVKAAGLVSRFGEKGFDYCGNSSQDIAVWQKARAAVVVSAPRRILDKAQSIGNVAAVFNTERRMSLRRAVLKALRPVQWAKNVLVFAPLVAAHRFLEVGADLKALAAFFSFSACASAVYVMNDMLDMEADRQHPVKARRPFAAGHLPLLTGGWIALGALGVALFFALFLPGGFFAALLGYYLLSTTYSLALKKLPMADILCLAALHTARIVAGAVAVSVPLSFWFLLFALFLFLSLAIAKRYAELKMMVAKGRDAAAGRGYLTSDLPVLMTFGIVSGYLSIMVLALYINSPAVLSLYSHPHFIWLLCVLGLYWVSRLWLKAHRGELPDDPVMFAVTDKASYVIGVLSLLTIFAAI